MLNPGAKSFAEPKGRANSVLATAVAALCSHRAQYGDQADQLRMPSVTLIDAAIHYHVDHWRLSLNAQNLLDRIYANCQGANYCAYGLRRAVTARASYLW